MNLEQRFYGHELHNTIQLTKVHSIFKNELTEYYSTPGEKHDFWEIVYVIEGTLFVESDSYKCTVSKGHIILHKPLEFHRHYVSNNKATLNIISFTADGDSLDTIASRSIEVNPFTESLIDESIRLSSEIFKSYNKNFTFVKHERYHPAYEQLLKNSIEAFLLSIIITEFDYAFIQSGTRQYSKESETISSQIIDYLKNRVSEDICLDDIANNFHLSKTTISLKFKSETNRSIMEYFRYLKILEGIDLMKNTSLSISDIAYKLNFSNPQHFSEQFKKHTGHSPSRYKKSMSKILVISKRN